MPALRQLADALEPQGRGVRRRRQDRPHAPAGRHADPPGPGVQRLRAAGRALALDRAGRRQCRACASCRSAAPPSAPGINTHPEFAAHGHRASRRANRHARSCEATNHFEAQAAKDAVGRGVGRAQDDRRSPDQDRQRHPLAGLGPALRHRRDLDSRHAAGQLDHARQGQPGDERDGAAGRPPR